MHPRPRIKPAYIKDFGVGTVFDGCDKYTGKPIHHGPMVFDIFHTKSQTIVALDLYGHWRIVDGNFKIKRVRQMDQREWDELMELVDSIDSEDKRLAEIYSKRFTRSKIMKSTTKVQRHSKYED